MLFELLNLEISQKPAHGHVNRIGKALLSYFILVGQAGNVDRCGWCRQWRQRYVTVGFLWDTEHQGGCPHNHRVGDVLEVTVKALAGGAVLVMTENYH